MNHVVRRVVPAVATAAVLALLGGAGGEPEPVESPADAGLPPAVSTFTTLPPGAVLPGDGECADRVRRTGWEPRQSNAIANHTPGMPLSRTPVEGIAYERVTGAFTGTTDEILQWGACKWGFDEELVRAVAAQESGWRQDMVGDQGLSLGILQVKRTSHPGTYPLSQTSTAFNVDYALAWRRACFEGAFLWLNGANKRGGYQAGDEWGCVGAWFSGDWYDDGARDYILRVRRQLAARPWTRSGF